MSFSVHEVAEWIGGSVVNSAVLGGHLHEIRVEKISNLDACGTRDIAFFFSRAYEKALIQSLPGILVTDRAFVEPMERAGLPLWKQTAVLSCADPYLAMAQVSEKFAAKISTVAHLTRLRETEIHPSAVVHATAQVGLGVRIGPHCVIEERARIGAGSVLYPGCFIGPFVEVGEDCVLFPNVALYEWTRLGNQVRLHSGVVVGADGFGYAPIKSPAQSQDQLQEMITEVAATHSEGVMGHQKIYHLGRVAMGNRVEIGANSCVDRGTFGDTVIGDDVKIDNQVQVGHNVQIGRGTVICGCAGLAGSAKVGEFVYIGGAAKIGNQIQIGNRANIGAGSMISKDVPAGGAAAGNPQREHRDHFRAHAILNRLISDKKNKKKRGHG